MQKQVKKKEISKRDRYTIVLEDLNSKIGLLVDGQQMIREDLDRFKVETENNFKTIFNHFLRVDGELQNFKTETGNNFKLVFDYLSRTDDRIGNVENELREIKTEIKDLKREFQNKAGLERVIALEQKVNMLEQMLIKQKMLKV